MKLGPLNSKKLQDSLERIETLLEGLDKRLTGLETQLGVPAQQKPARRSTEVLPKASEVIREVHPRSVS